MALVLVYTFEGGMKAVIWTDVVQFLLYFSGSLAGFFLLLHKIPGGWETVVHAAAATHKFRIFDFSFSLVNPAKTYTFWSGVIGGGFLTMASHGTDQTIVQRLLAAKSERESKMALLASGVIILFQFALFLVLGVMLYAWHGAPVIHPGQSYDGVFPDFIVTVMPSGMRGIMIAAIVAVAMSNASGSLNSLAASTVMDFHELRGISIPAGNSPGHILRLSRRMTLSLGHRSGDPGHVPMGAVAGSRLNDCFHHFRQPAWTLPPGVSSATCNARGSANRHVCGARRHALHLLLHTAAVDLVCARRRGNYFCGGRIDKFLRWFARSGNKG